MATRPTIFKWRQTEPALILCAVRWYLRYSLSLRDVEEVLEERGLDADHTTVWRWVQRYGPELEQRLRRHLKPTNKSWRVDETYVRVKGRWVLPVPGDRFRRCHHRFPALSRNSTGFHNAAMIH
jgi:IS6 family transposase